MNDAAPHIFNRQVYRDRQLRASHIGQADLMAHVATDLAERLLFITRQFEHVLLIANAPQPFVEVLSQSQKCGTITLATPPLNDNLALPENTYNAVLSILDLQCVNDVPGYLVQLRRALKPDGLLLLCLFSGDTLKELREVWLAVEGEFSGGATPRVAPMIDARALGSLLQRAGFALPLVDQDRTVLRYPDPLKLCTEIKSMGYANPLQERTKYMTSQKLFGALLAQYVERFSDPDGKVRATIEIAWATGWCPDESQPKPLKPGSAKHRLADALQVKETKLETDD